MSLTTTKQCVVSQIFVKRQCIFPRIFEEYATQNTMLSVASRLCLIYIADANLQKTYIYSGVTFVSYLQKTYIDWINTLNFFVNKLSCSASRESVYSNPRQLT